MKTTTLQNFSKRLSQYSALTAAFTGLTEANSQEIVYTDLNPGVSVINDSYYLDFNGDYSDFTIRHRGSSTLGILDIQPTCCYNAILGNNFNFSSGGDYRYPFALEYGDLISASADPMGSPYNSWNSYYVFQNMDFFGSCGNPGYRSMWCGATDKYLGLRFEIFNISGNTTHYGWARLDVDNTAGAIFLIKDFAYNPSPDQPIYAGQKTLGLDENNLTSKIRVVALNKSIGLYNLPETVNYKLYTITGQEILYGKTNMKNHVIEADEFSSGIYILELANTNSDAVLRKKLVLN